MLDKNFPFRKPSTHTNFYMNFQNQNQKQNNLSASKRKRSNTINNNIITNAKRAKKHKSEFYLCNLLKLQSPLHQDVLWIINDYCDDLMKVGAHLLDSKQRRVDLKQVLNCCAADGDIQTFEDKVEPYQYQGEDICLHDPFMLAVKHGKQRMVKYLVKLGADIHPKYNCGLTLASENGHLDTVKYIVSVGANVTAEENEAVRKASKKGHLDVVKYLVSVGADINA